MYFTYVSSKSLSNYAGVNIFIARRVKLSDIYLKIPLATLIVTVYMYNIVYESIEDLSSSYKTYKQLHKLSNNPIIIVFKMLTKSY